RHVRAPPVVLWRLHLGCCEAFEELRLNGVRLPVRGAHRLRFAVLGVERNDEDIRLQSGPLPEVGQSGCLLHIALGRGNDPDLKPEAIARPGLECAFGTTNPTGIRQQSFGSCRVIWIASEAALLNGSKNGIVPGEVEVSRPTGR